MLSVIHTTQVRWSLEPPAMVQVSQYLAAARSQTGHQFGCIIPIRQQAQVITVYCSVTTFQLVLIFAGTRRRISLARTRRLIAESVGRHVLGQVPETDHTPLSGILARRRAVCESGDARNVRSAAKM